MPINALIRAVLAAFSVLAILSSVSATAQPASFDFGDDSSEYARDDECDDIRLIGPGMSANLLTDDIGRDASDCRAAMQQGRAVLNALFARPASDADIIFGDDASEFAFDGECDDVRFAHADSASAIYLVEDIGHDATDCRAGFARGTLRWQGDSARPVRGMSAAQAMDYEF